MIKGFFKKLFCKKDEVEVPQQEVIIKSAPSPSQIDLMREHYANEKEKSERMLGIQQRYENGDYDLSMMTDEEMADLMYLYHCQINEYRNKKEAINKKISKIKV